MPPPIPTRGPRNWVAGPLEDHDVVDEGAVLQRRVNNALGGDRLASTLALVAGDHDAGLAV